MWKLLCLCLCLHVCCTLVHSSSRKSDEETRREYVAKFQRAFNQTAGSTGPTRNLVGQSALDPPNPFTCDTDTPDWYTPATDVHMLTPWDISIVAAMGDSVTAGFGAAASTIIGDIIEYRWLSWSIGGHQSIDTVSTLPNIIKRYNPNLRGYSGGILTPRLNVAVTGAVAEGVYRQAERLVEDMEDYGDNSNPIDEQWKVITLWIGANDLCDVCDGDPAQHAMDYAQRVWKSLDYLSKNVKRAYVNLVDMIDITQLMKLDGFWCDIVHFAVCKCATEEKTQGRVRETARLYNVYLEDMLQRSNYFDREDFTVALQPFFSDTSVPIKDGKGDMDYFAPDCFHFSTKGHGVGALYLWNNMLEKLGDKTDSIDWDDLQDYKCVTKENPYFTTDNPLSTLKKVGRENEEGGGSDTQLVPILVGTLLAVLVVAVMVIVIAGAVVVHKRRKSSFMNTEKMHLVSVKL